MVGVRRFERPTRCPQSKMREPEYRRITLCEKPSITKMTEVTSRFEMLIGEQWRKAPAPWDGKGHN